jgi:hypothetical protein
MCPKYWHEAADLPRPKSAVAIVLNGLRAINPSFNAVVLVECTHRRSSGRLTNPARTGLRRKYRQWA